MNLRERIQEFTSPKILRGFEGLAGKSYDFNIEDPLAQLQRIKGIQETRISEGNKPLPTIFIFNHLAGDDPIVVLDCILRNLKGCLGPLMVPVSAEYTHFPNVFKMLGIAGACLADKIKHNENEDHTHALKSSLFNGAYATVVWIARNLVSNISMPPLTQAYRSRTDKSGEKGREALQHVLSLKHEIEKQCQEGVTIAVSLEGHRGNGKLQPAESGLGLIIELLLKKKIPESLVVPIGIGYEPEYSQVLNFNLRKKIPVTLKIGRALTIQEVLNGAINLKEKYGIGESEEKKRSEKQERRSLIVHYLMLELRNLLPPKMWGVYAEDLLKRTLNGDFELVIDEDGKVRVFDKVTHLFID